MSTVKRTKFWYVLLNFVTRRVFTDLDISLKVKDQFQKSTTVWLYSFIEVRYFQNMVATNSLWMYLLMWNFDNANFEETGRESSFYKF